MQSITLQTILRDMLAAINASPTEQDKLHIIVPDLHRAEVVHGSACSGTDGYLAGLNALQAALTEFVGDAMDNRCSWACEADARTQRFLKSMSENAYQDMTCKEGHHIFSDIKDLHAGRAHCCVHGQSCDVPRIDCAWIGFSCKDFSKQSNP